MGTIKIVVNKCFGGFQLSTKAYEWLIKKRKWVVVSPDEAEKMRKYKYQEKYQAYLIEAGKKYEPIGIKYFLYTHNTDLRTHPDIIAVVKALGKKACDNVSELKIIEIPDDAEWELDEYDGVEWIAEKHRTWR